MSSIGQDTIVSALPIACRYGKQKDCSPNIFCHIINRMRTLNQLSSRYLQFSTSYFSMRGPKIVVVIFATVIIILLGTARITSFAHILSEACRPKQFVGPKRAGNVIFLVSPPFYENHFLNKVQSGSPCILPEQLNTKSLLKIERLLCLVQNKIIKLLMRSLSLNDAIKTIDITSDKLELHEMSTTFQSVATIDVETSIRNKIKTFTNWNYRTALSRRKKQQDNIEIQAIFRDRSQTNSNSLYKNIISAIMQKAKDQNKRKGKKEVKVDELEGVKTQRRERFKKMQNPSHIIQYYISKEGYNPNAEENLLLGRIIELRQKIDMIQPFDLDIALEHIYKTMNIAVDLNQTKFLILIIMMAGEVCFEAKEFKSSFFFYTQVMIASTCTRSWSVKLEALTYLGRICMENFEHEKAMIFFKKALQYAWKIREQEAELKLYDYIGECLNFEGQCEIALYYHNRYIQGQNQSLESAVRRISSEMLAEYEKTLDNSEKQNLSELFLQYLRLPITNFAVYPPTKTSKLYQNYKDQTSPRKNRREINFNYRELPELTEQVSKLLNQSNEFATEIPNPDLHRNFLASEKYAKHKKTIQFTQSNDFHKIVGIKIKEIDKSILKLPIEVKAAKILQEKTNPHWWEDIKYRAKKERNHKLGSIRNKVEKMHLGYSKYPEQRRKSQSYRAQKINQSFNKTILNWIDPPKKQRQI